ncbi:MAG TPA: DNA translocase FtsK 4TM domain-containing protein [Bryobacteraceae bacterium]|nr:DNA translocase FtsK 4TM domain-containing protein [Bryobacteraceae bacterium]
MTILGPTRYPRLNEGIGLVYLALGIAIVLSLVSYHPTDISWNTVGVKSGKPLNLIGKAGAHTADILLQLGGLGAFTLPVLLFALAWKWLRSEPIGAQMVKLIGSTALALGACTAFSLGPEWRPFGGAIAAGGLIGGILSDLLLTNFNATGAFLVTAMALVLATYLVSSFSMAKLALWLAGPMAFFKRLANRFASWRDIRRQRKLERKRERAEQARLSQERRVQEKRTKSAPQPAAPEFSERQAAPTPDLIEQAIQRVEDAKAPWEDEIPIRTLEDAESAQTTASSAVASPATVAPPVPEPVVVPLASEPEPVAASAAARTPTRKVKSSYLRPPTEMLNEPQARLTYDSQELKDIASAIKSKFEEFNVMGSVVQINPGPVVTTFEFKPEAGVKYSRITTLTEDLCLGLEVESVLIERIPGKPTVGIEVPNSKREVISLRQILESDEFRNSQSPMTMSLGKDISGRIKVAALESMPHLLIAGSTGSGKSVMLNTLIMSMLYKSTPDEVRMIMVDPKRVELGIYEGIPHLLTPVITDARKATNALRNAVLEMERRLKLLASQGVRNIDQFNRKVRQLQQVPRSLFEQEPEPVKEELTPLPYILIIIDELADLMMLERHNVEESVTRLAQMARAVGMHLVLATQRPSVDVITGLIKANFPARISFRVATRVDSRTILDVMGAEHLLGKGDMLFLPPGSSRLTRVHGAYVNELEVESVVQFWKDQARPEYDQSFLLAPPEGEAADNEDEDFDGEQDPMYQDAVRCVLEMGKASTSTLQRRLRLGYGRAARILDMMQKEGIIGPPDGSRPREVLKRPDWLEEVEQQLR